MSTLGVISDTHGLLRPEALEALMGVDLILHAGDVGSVEVLDGLRAVAPVHAVRGNMDGAGLGLPLTTVVEVGGVMLYVLHDLYRLDLDPRAAGFVGVVSGHTHRPSLAQRDGVLYLNPGSAGPRRSDRPPSVGLILVEGGRVRGELIELRC